MSGPVTLAGREAPMYEEFYGFARPPFTLAPDPRFLYLSDTHDDAIRLLLQAIRRKEGFIVLTGDIGTGKTTLCRVLMERLDRTTFISLVLNPFVSVEELLKEILLDFGVLTRDAVRNGKLAGATRHELVATLHDFLLSLQPLGAVAVLIIDEAQHLPAEALEQVRILSNLETNTAKLLQIVLVGQLDLLPRLAASDMRQLNQRISLRATLEPLSRIEMEAYVGHRLDVARGSPAVAFDEAALDLIHAQSGGVPRVVNLLCDRALMLGADAGSNTIDRKMVEGAIAALGLEPVRVVERRPAWPRVVLMLLVLAITAAAAAFWLTPAELIVEAPAPPGPPSPPAVRAGPPVPRLTPPDTTPPLYPPDARLSLPASP